ncbi:zinc finger protein [Wuchereria bancrofti]|uniref:Zinc finger protein n=1 Tax=Wuchereria bancrofti TaxID=6293 RepID=J9EBV5_WUCBA|nr:zinc finger protein [Wuchereria bancrofti]
MSNRLLNLNVFQNWQEIIFTDMRFIYFFFFFQLSNIQTTVAQTDQTEPLDLSIAKVKEKGNGSQGLSMERENEQEIGLQMLQTKPLDLSAPKREDEEEIGLQMLQTKPLDLSAPKVKENGDKSQGLSVVGVSDEQIKPLLQLVPIETPVEVTELSKQKRRMRKKRRCDMCQQEVAYMNKHMKTHTGEKPYSCPTCKKNFTVLDSVNKHMMIHTGEKPYNCPICGRSFTQKQHLQSHMVTHDINRPVYHCTVCSKDFQTKFSLKFHMRNH